MENTMRRSIITVVATLAVSAAMLLPSSAQAQFLKIDDIPGESANKDHAQWIDILSYSQTIDPSSARTPPRGPGAITITRRVDKTSPRLAEAIAKSKRFREVVISVPNTGATRDRQPYLQYRLKNVYITSVGTRAADGGDAPIETLSLNYTEIEF
jgi:type VI secretion system secreted protein Hcp